MRRDTVPMESCGPWEAGAAAEIHSILPASCPASLGDPRLDADVVGWEPEGHGIAGKEGRQSVGAVDTGNRVSYCQAR